METGTYITVGNEHEFLSQLGRVVQIGDREIAVFRTSDHQWFALENKKPASQRRSVSRSHRIRALHLRSVIRLEDRAFDRACAGSG
ncbi:nitrite reductase [NAD(P)H], small subunit [Actinobacillus pleuropneumoniae]|nr:nitrite reductase [NAD(P)H], small subunit [Actinobacillus pleuropneumoniae]